MSKLSYIIPVLLTLVNTSVVRASNIELLNQTANKSKTGSELQIAQNQSWRDQAAILIQNEPSVVEAMFPNNARNSFWVSMRDDGSKRDGFAQYVCLELMSNGMQSGDFIVIKIWDAAKMVQGELSQIGRHNCKKN